MPLPDPFLNGVTAVFQIKWDVELKTPLIVRMDRKFAWNDNMEDKKKARNHKVGYFWKTTEQGKNKEISDLNFEIHLIQNNGRLSALPQYSVPASSLRGSLRSWTVRHLMKNDEWPWSNFSWDDGQTTDYVEKMQNKIEKGSNGFALLCHLFGMTVHEKEYKSAKAGRVHFQTEPFKESHDGKPGIHGVLAENNQYGPVNARVRIKSRGPVDRITHAPKAGGFHTFLEFAPNQSFPMLITVQNPQPHDLGLIALWEREMNDGMLRLGALTSIGRGQVEVKVSQGFPRLFLSKAGAKEMSAEFPQDRNSDTDADPVASLLWNNHTVNWNASGRNHLIELLKIQCQPQTQPV